MLLSNSFGIIIKKKKNTHTQTKRLSYAEKIKFYRLRNISEINTAFTRAPFLLSYE